MTASRWRSHSTSRAGVRPVPPSRSSTPCGAVSPPLVAMNQSGGLVYAPAAESLRQLLWVNRSGETRPAVAERRAFGALRISPDGQRVATTIGTGSHASIWIHDVRNGTLTPLTGSNGARNAAWSSDGRRVLYVSTQGGRAAFWWQAADGSSAPAPASVPPHNAWNMDLAPDDVTTVYNAIYNGPPTPRSTSSRSRWPRSTRSATLRRRRARTRRTRGSLATVDWSPINQTNPVAPRSTSDRSRTATVEPRCRATAACGRSGRGTARCSTTRTKAASWPRSWREKRRCA